jgi:prophage regulatory protein
MRCAEGNTMQNNLLKLRDVRDATGLSKTAVYKLQRNGQFPQAVRIGERAVAWPESEVAAWVAARVAERDAGRAA